MAKKFVFRNLAGLILLIIAVFVITNWVNHHFENTGIYTMIVNGVALLYTITTLLSSVMTEDDEAQNTKSLQKILKFWISTPVLVIIYFIIMAVGCTISTIQVYTGSEETDVEVKIGTEGSTPNRFGRITAKESRVTKVVFTNPFGSDYYIEVPGYQRKPIKVYSWVSTTVLVEYDLEPSPSVLIRFDGQPEELINYYFSFRQPGSPDSILVRVTGGKSAAVMLGTPRSLPAHLDPEWRDEIRSYAPNDERYLSTMMRGWKNIIYCDKLGLEPGVNYDMRVHTENKSLWGTLNVIVLDEPFQDFLLERLPPETKEEENQDP